MSSTAQINEVIGRGVYDLAQLLSLGGEAATSNDIDTPRQGRPPPAVQSLARDVAI
jgi:hypothetical protein